MVCHVFIATMRTLTVNTAASSTGPLPPATLPASAAECGVWRNAQTVAQTLINQLDPP